MKEKLEKMLDVEIEKLEEKAGELIVYVQPAFVGTAIGSGGSVVRSAELIIGKPIRIISI